jgi:hypothetical protein
LMYLNMHRYARCKTHIQEGNHGYS